MKLCRVGAIGAETPAFVDRDGTLRDLSGVIADLGPDQLAPASLARLAAIDPATLPPIEGTPRYGVPVAGTRQFVAAGLNYADHAAETNLAVPTEPAVFTKWVSCLQGANDPIVIPRGSTKTDWEVELGVVIGTRASCVAEADALAHVAGYLVVNDVSEREWQLERGPTWNKGKGFPTFGPVGPWLVTANEVGDPHRLALWLEVNGRRVQDGNSDTMIFGIPRLLSYISEFMTLLPGDIVTTGTPPGVGMGQKPAAWFLKPGDSVRLGIDGLGEQRQAVVGWQPAS